MLLPSQGIVKLMTSLLWGGLSGAHQFTRIGCHVMISGGSMMAQDIAPYSIVQGDRAKTVGINLTGLKRRGFSAESPVKYKKICIRLFFAQISKLEEAISKIEGQYDSAASEVGHLCQFFEAKYTWLSPLVLSYSLLLEQITRESLALAFCFYRTL